jgi:exonuclease III
MKSIIYFAFAFLSLSLTAQETINTMFYNLLEFPEASPGGRSEILRNIFSEFEPDIFMVCELQSEAGADEILNISLNYNLTAYSRSEFIPNQSGEANLQQLIYFKTEKFSLESSEIITTTVRDINKYVLKLNTVDQETDPILIYIYVTHLKSSQGSANQNLRLDMVSEFTSDLELLDPNSFVIFAGDFNIYTSSEPAYQELLDNTNAILMVDPINTPGSWHNNDTYQDIHSQSTRINSGPFGAGAGGGLDDRFDFITVSENMTSDPRMNFIIDSYKSFGNNGNCFNLDISDESCLGEYNQQLRNNLFSMSDHLPVVMQLETNKEFVLSTSEFSLTEEYTINSTLVNDVLKLTIKKEIAKNTSFAIYNTLGQKVKEINNNNKTYIHVNVSGLASGLYYIKSNLTNNTILKFIKK